MSARDYLAKLAFIADNHVAGDPHAEWDLLAKNPKYVGYVYEIADAILANGWRPPARTITTREELDAAIYAAFEDAGHLIVSDRRGRPWIIWADEDDDAWVDSWPQEEDPERLTLSEIALPATVLHEPVKP